jgi:hypothetical protein
MAKLAVDHYLDVVGRLLPVCDPESDICRG